MALRHAPLLWRAVTMGWMIVVWAVIAIAYIKGLATMNRLPLLIKGPTGCGKTRFVEHMAARLGLPLSPWPATTT
jgi:hypothetical protein